MVFSCVSLLEMVVPDVDATLLEELESMGFSKERSTRALHFSGEWSESLLVILQLAETKVVISFM